MVVAGGRALPILKIHQAAVMLGRDVDEAATGVPARSEGQFERAVNMPSRFKLTFELDPVSDQKGEIGGYLEALCGAIHEGALTGGSVAVHEALPVDGDAKVVAWIGPGRPFIRVHAGLFGNAKCEAVDARRCPAVISNVLECQHAGQQGEDEECREHDHYLN